LISGLAGILLTGLSFAAPEPLLPVPPQDHILLVGGRTFAGGSRVEETLNAMAAASGVIGDSRFALLSEADFARKNFAAILKTWGKPRAILAVVGDLSYMKGIDPTVGIPVNQNVLSSRKINEARLATAMDRLEANARLHKVPLVFVTAPLGKQGRVETPELLRVARAVRERDSTLDLQALFQERESTPLFLNGIDILDNFGHEETARLIFKEICSPNSLLPARTDEERQARATQRALDAWMAADESGFEAAAKEALRSTSTTTLGKVRQAAVYTARDGFKASWRRWASIDSEESQSAPLGLTLALALSRRAPASLTSSHPFEAKLLAVAKLILSNNRTEAWNSSQELIAQYPHRPEAWIISKIASRTAHQQDVMSDAQFFLTLEAMGWQPIAKNRVLEALQTESGATMSLPVMLIASAPYETLTPTGPALEQCRRTYQMGLRGEALRKWKRDTSDLLVPPAWHDTIDQMKARGTK
jgi:hypothetical protein